MKTRLFLLLLCSVFLSSVRAELVVYRESENARVIGSGVERGVHVTTYWVYNPTTYEFNAIGYFAIGSTKVYAITNIARLVPSREVTGRNGRHIVFSRILTTNDSPDVLFDCSFARGVVTYLDIGNGQRITSMPRSMKATTRGLQRVNGNLAIYESTSSIVFQFSETKRANDAGDSAAAVIERLRQRLAKQGYEPAS